MGASADPACRLPSARARRWAADGSHARHHARRCRESRPARCRLRRQPRRHDRHRRDDPDGEHHRAGPRVCRTHHARSSSRSTCTATSPSAWSRNCDLIVGYRTNPHVDMTERGEEAALALRLILAGLADPKSAFIRLPLTPAPVGLLTASGPYGDMIDYGTRRRAELAGDILNVSIFGGFVFADSDKNGVAIVVTARHDQARARCSPARSPSAAGRTGELREDADAAWPAPSTLARTAQPKPAVILAERGDNPGGGGTGRSTELLAALHRAGRENSCSMAASSIRRSRPRRTGRHRRKLRAQLQHRTRLALRRAVRGRRRGRRAPPRHHRRPAGLGAGPHAPARPLRRAAHRGATASP